MKSADGLLPGYEHQILADHLGWTPGTPWKVGLHSTESGENAVGLLDHWRGNPGSGCPHFLGLTPKRIVQTLPLLGGAYTAQNPAGGIDTNRAHIVQIEVCNWAINPGALIDPRNPGLGTREDWREEWYDALGQWLADLVNFGLELDLETELVFGDHWQGLDPNVYLRSSVVMGHQHIPEQPDRHWDPGELRIGHLLEKARARLGRPSTPPEDDMTPPEFASYLTGIPVEKVTPNDVKVWFCDAMAYELRGQRDAEISALGKPKRGGANLEEIYWQLDPPPGEGDDANTGRKKVAVRRLVDRLWNHAGQPS